MKWMCILLSCMVVACSLFLFAFGARYRLTGRWFPKNRIDKLSQPVSVTSWTTAGLQLADGRTVMPLGMTTLPKASLAIEVVTRSGVEVDVNGTVWGLVQIEHWCGNDPVEEDIRRIDVGKLLSFLKLGKSSMPPSPQDYVPSKIGGSISYFGWNSLEAAEFELFSKGIKDPE